MNTNENAVVLTTDARRTTAPRGAQIEDVAFSLERQLREVELAMPSAASTQDK